MTNKQRKDLYQDITNRIIAGLETASGNNWKRPWSNVFTGTPIDFPHNLQGRPYSGINVFLLALAAPKASKVNVWGTYKAWQGVNAQVRKGEKSTEIIYFKMLKRKEDGEEKTFPLMRGYRVFHASQIEGFDEDAYIEKHHKDMLDADANGEAMKIAKAEELLNNYLMNENIKVNVSSQASYSPKFDVIGMPHITAFKDVVQYYGTKAHEVVHSTGHKNRLNREFQNRFGDKAYAFEELVAELGASFLAAEMSLEDKPRQDHVDYIANWIQILKDDKKAIFTAATAAKKAAKYVVESTAEIAKAA